MLIVSIDAINTIIALSSNSNSLRHVLSILITFFPVLIV